MRETNCFLLSMMMSAWCNQHQLHLKLQAATDRTDREEGQILGKANNEQMCTNPN